MKMYWHGSVIFSCLAGICYCTFVTKNVCIFKRESYHIINKILRVSDCFNLKLKIN